ncbi:MAG: asparagine synthase (glutamine-hydrolyzing) [Chlorobium sp.]
MCGIFLASLPLGRPFVLDRLLDNIIHRGPDDSGVFVSEDGTSHLGHVRLSIVDLSSAAHQPMADASGRFIISYNGEVYNYRELKRSLENTYGTINWKSTSDTEVIVEGFAREGIGFFSRLNGIFALGIFDSYTRSLHILRDPLGIKPLFYTRQNGCSFFCSELKGLLAIPLLSRTLRRQSLADQLAFMYVPEPYTLFEEFVKVVPGVCITYREGERVASSNVFDHLVAPIAFSSENDIIERFYSTFSASVKRQLVSDVPVSLMLSGGLDSSAVAHEVVSCGGNVKDAYTISYSAADSSLDQQSDDLFYARLIAKRLGLELKVIPAQANFIDLLPGLSKFLEDGISDPAAINTYLICEAARNSGVKVMLTGQGADEFLGGYRRYSAERMIASVPGFLGVPFKFAGSLLPESLPGRFNALNRRIKRLLHLAGQNRRQRLLGMYIWNVPEKISRLFLSPDSVEIGEDLMKLFDDFGYHDVVDTMMRVDQKYDLTSLNLTYTDRMSMANGVEARVPFLDFELVRLMNSIPSKVKMKHGEPKYVLKKAMEAHLPRQIVYREKAGFGLPIRAWMRNENEMFRYYFDIDRIRNQGIFDPNALYGMYKENLAGKGDHSNVLFSMLCIQVWLDSQSCLTTN